jgi:hypothetical protein
MSNNYINGYLLFSTCLLASNKNIIEICKKNNKQDYDTITDLFK